MQDGLHDLTRGQTGVGGLQNEAADLLERSLII
jgi:hypothetical protein